mmetsp:Transcript_14041/g.28121  ORF Transcript_14041/g.28121 Transcript_14041/m.28121 type:complete len:82 (+) Transcript_14041:1446-1691(+)
MDRRSVVHTFVVSLGVTSLVAPPTPLLLFPPAAYQNPFLTLAHEQFKVNAGNGREGGKRGGDREEVSRASLPYLIGSFHVN